MQASLVPFSVSPYDNDTSLLYKYAGSKGIPVRYVRLRPRRSTDLTKEERVFFSVADLLGPINAGDEQALRDIEDYAPDLSAKDITGLYLHSLTGEMYTEERLEEANNFYARLAQGQGFSEVSALRSFYEDYAPNFDKQVASDANRIKKVSKVQKLFDLLSKEPMFPISPITVNGTAISFSPSFAPSSKRVSPEDGLEIFDQSILSVYVPFVQYNDGERKYFKVYEGKTAEELPDIELITGLSSNNNEPYKLFLTIWTGDQEENGSEVFYHAPKNSFSRVEYSLSSNTLLINTPLQSEENLGTLATRRVQRALPMLSLGSGMESKLGGWFDLFFLPRAAGDKAIRLEEVSFINTLINDELMPYYFYTEERTKPYALKKNIDINYRSLFEEERVGSGGEATSGAIVSMKLKQRRADVNETHTILLDNQKIARILPRNTYYLHVKISKAANRKVLEEFINLFRLLMVYHELSQLGVNIEEEEDGQFVKVEGGTSVYDNYKSFIPELDELYTPVAIAKKVVKKGEAVPSKNDQLHETAPNLWPKGAGRHCLCPNQPIIIDKEDIEEWENYTFSVKGIPTKRTIRQYPEGDGWYFVCPGNKNPHMNFKFNKWFDNGYKYLPCCSKKPLAPGKYPKEKVGAKAENIIITQKFLQPGGWATLPKHVSSALKSYIPGATGISILRQGVTRSVNSFLHSVCTALGDDDAYSSIDEEQDKEAYVIKLRRAIANNTRPELLKQELYDYPDRSISNLLADVSIFFDPLIFYRAVEEYFDINIYIFSTSREDEREEKSDGRMLIPRYTKFHAHSQHIDRKTVLIFRNMGSESDLLPYPQCELIIDHTEERKGEVEITTIFGRDMAELCHNVMIDTLGTITWDDVHRTNPDLYSFIDYNSLIDYAGVEQHLDGDGRMRGLNFDLKSGAKLTRVTMFFPPSQPTNLPMSKTVYYPPADLIMNVWGKAQSASSTSRNPLKVEEIIGIWFPVYSLQEGVFFPVASIVVSSSAVASSAVASSAITTLATKPIGPPSPVPSVRKESITQRVRRLERTLTLLMQLVEWLYLVHCRNGVDLDGFYLSYFAYDRSPVEDSADYYDFSLLPRRLPEIDSVAQGISIMSQYAPTLFNHGKLAMYSASFAAKVLKTLKGNLTLTRLILLRLKHNERPDKGITQLRGYYLYEEDFRQQQDVIVFIGSGNLHRWIRSTVYYDFRHSFRVYDYILPETFKNGERVKQPYVYYNNGTYYLIQNVVTGSREAAAAVVKVWVELGYNPGYDVEALQLQELPIMKVYIASGDELLVETDLSRGLNTFIELLHYKNGRYAAMIKLA